MSEHLTKITVHLEYTHECGQVLEEIFRMKTDQYFSMDMLREPLIDTAQPLDKLNLGGYVEKVEIAGMEIREGKGAYCLKCDANLLLPSLDKEQRNEH